MHHAKNEPQPEIEQIAKDNDLGATGKFPDGKLTDNDEGQIKMAVGTHKGQVILNFGTPVSWIGFTPREARQLAELLRQHSYKTQE